MRKISLLAILFCVGCTSEADHEIPQLVAHVEDHTTPQIIGAWRSPRIGEVDPTWMIDTYHEDGTMTTKYFSEKRGRIYNHTDQQAEGLWEFKDGKLHVSVKNVDGDYEVVTEPRPVHIDKDGNISRIGSWTLMERGVSHPEYRAIRVGMFP